MQLTVLHQVSYAALPSIFMCCYRRRMQTWLREGGNLQQVSGVLSSLSALSWLPMWWMPYLTGITFLLFQDRISTPEKMACG